MLRHSDAAAGPAWQAMRALHPLTIQSSSVSHFCGPYSGITAHGTTQRPLALHRCIPYSDTPQPQPKDQPPDHTPSPSETASDFATAKPFSAIPSPKRIPLIGVSRDFMKFSTRIFSVYQRVEKLGKLYREKLVPGLPEFVFTLDPEDVAKVFRADGRHPRRFPISEWADVRKQLNIPIGFSLL